jgi:hypothetical protein
VDIKAAGKFHFKRMFALCNIHIRTTLASFQYAYIGLTSNGCYRRIHSVVIDIGILLLLHYILDVGINSFVKFVYLPQRAKEGLLVHSKGLRMHDT